MAYLMQIGFDNDRRLRRRYYLFEYRGIRFKLVQNRRKWADHLLTILPSDDQTGRERAFSVASQFISALGWEHGARVGVWEVGGAGWPDSYRLEQARPNIFTFRRIPDLGSIFGYDLVKIPNITTRTQRIALALFREANASNSDYLSFLFFWQVLEVGGGDAKSYVDETFANHAAGLRLERRHTTKLPLGSRSLGQYLLDDCRHAIAHIRRRPGRKQIDIDKPDDRMRLTISTEVIKAFAEHYIRHELHVCHEHLYLVRRKRGDFPVFAQPQLLSGAWQEAYSRRRALLSRPRFSGTGTLLGTSRAEPRSKSN